MRTGSAPSDNNGLVAGIDSSTQSTKVVVCDAATGQVVREADAPHTDGTEIDPSVWWRALERACDGLLDGVDALGVAAQQHGMVTLDERGAVVRPALLWNDTRSAEAAARLTKEWGGPRAFADLAGSVPVASLTVTKLRWMAEHEPESADRVRDVMLPHDWLTRNLTGGEPVTDRGDASGTGYWSPSGEHYLTDLLTDAFGGRIPGTPRVLAPAEPAGRTASGRLVSAGTGDNMAAALGLGIEPGDVVVSLGTSGTVFACSDTPAADASGAVAGFADATGRFLPLVCTLNAARVLTATAEMLGVDMDEFDRLACSAAAGAGGITLLPYLDGERTPNLPDASGTLHGLRRDNMTPRNLARAAVEGMLCGLAEGLEALRGQQVPVRRVLLIGGAARSLAVRTCAPRIFGVPVTVPAPAEYVAIGAARQAAWALAASERPPAWPVATEAESNPIDHDEGRRIRNAHRAAVERVHPEQA